MRVENQQIKHPEIVKRMKAELETWQQSVQRSYRGEDYPGGKLAAPPK
ncbi:MAG: hypothetical protein NTU53_16935 [Planctomycetota bacterium]|nr:hypothetical protein [Planctomycetota bacterium]